MASSVQKVGTALSILALLTILLLTALPRLLSGDAAYGNLAAQAGPTFKSIPAALATHGASSPQLISKPTSKHRETKEKPKADRKAKTETGKHATAPSPAIVVDEVAPITATSPPFSEIEREQGFVQLPSATFWSNWTIIAAEGSRTIFVPYADVELKELMEQTPKPKLARGNSSLGQWGIGLVFCDLWSVTYSIWLRHCLPRLLNVYPRLKSLTSDATSPLYIVCPGEYFAIQYLVEVLHIPEDHILLLPAHIVWLQRYPNFYLQFDTLFYALPLAEESVGLMLVSRAVLAGIGSTSKLAAARAKQTKFRVLFSERADMTMPANHSRWLNDLQDALGRVGGELIVLRFETFPVVKQLALIRTADVFMGPSGANLLNAMFLRPNATVVELSNTSISTSPYLASLCAALGLRHFLIAASRPSIYKRQALFPIFEVISLIRSLQSHHPITGLSGGPLSSWSAYSTFLVPPTSPSSNGTVFAYHQLSPPLLPCQSLLHLPRRRIFIGWYKQTYLIPSHGFALKHPRNGMWKNFLREMTILRNLTGPHITPAVALCFDKTGVSYAQQLIAKLLGRILQWTNNRTANTVPVYLTALGGYLRLWRALTEPTDPGRYLFYCDSNPRNWAIGFDGTLKMFDFDATIIVPVGSLCETDAHCGCPGKTPGPQSMCVQGRCSATGMANRLLRYVRGWIRSAMWGLRPLAISGSEIYATFGRGGSPFRFKYSDVVEFIQRWGKTVGFDVCSTGIPECDESGRLGPVMPLRIPEIVE